MAQVKPRVIVFDDFTKGEFGLATPIEYGDHGKTGLWTGSGGSLTILPDGSVCPQPDPKAQTTTGLSGTAVDMGMGNKSTGQVLWVKTGNKIYQSGAGPTFAFSANSGTSGDSVSFLDRVASGTNTYAVTAANGLDVIDHAGGSIAAGTGSPPACSCVEQYNDRLILGGSGSDANKLWFSAAGDFASWPAANFITVGDSAPIVAIKALRGFLLIIKSGGTDETWWTLRGTPGVNAVLRRTSRFQGPGRPNNLAATNDNRIAFGVQAQSNGNNGDVAPAFFDGANGRIESAQKGSALDSTLATEAYRMVDSSDLLLKNGLGGLFRRRGAWTRYALPSPLFPNTSNFGVSSRTAAVDRVAGTFYVLNHAGDTIYKWHPYATRPAFSADTDGAVPATAGRFTLPEWRAAAGDEVCVKSVVVAFRKYLTGTGGDNSFTAIVTSTGQYPHGVSVDATPDGTWTEAATAAIGNPLARETFTYGPQWGNGFTVQIANIVGVAIRSVTVLCETRPLQGVA